MGMKTYDELYDDIKRKVDGYEVVDFDDWHRGAYYVFRYVLGELEEIREAEEKQTKEYIAETKELKLEIDKLEDEIGDLLEYF